MTLVRLAEGGQGQGGRLSGGVLVGPGDGDGPGDLRAGLRVGRGQQGGHAEGEPEGDVLPGGGPGVRDSSRRSRAVASGE